LGAWGLVVPPIAGFLGAHAAAGATLEYRVGFLGHSFVGLVGGALSGTFLQAAAVTIVTGSGSQIHLPRGREGPPYDRGIHLRDTSPMKKVGTWPN
jgi:hypothetical protein